MCKEQRKCRFHYASCLFGIGSTHNKYLTLCVWLLQNIEEPSVFLEEDREWMRSDPIVRVEKMFKKIEAKFTGPPRFILCVLPEKKTCDIYGESNLLLHGFLLSIATSVTYILLLFRRTLEEEKPLSIRYRHSMYRSSKEHQGPLFDQCPPQNQF